MAISLKGIKNRIKSVENTQKVTYAMQMVSVAKLNRVDKVLLAIRPYCLRIEGLLDHLASMPDAPSHPLFAKRVPVGRKLLCVITSDNGLCGSYNTGLLRSVDEFMRQNTPESFDVIAIGKKGFNFLRSKGLSIRRSCLGLNGRYDHARADEISREFLDLFTNQKVDEVWCAHTHFETAVIQRFSLEKILPIEPKKVEAKEFIVEPDLDFVLHELAEHSVMMKMRRIIAESFTSEHASRVMAMKGATENAGELLGNLLVARNKIRQASITREILEIISSSEALKSY